MLILTRRVGECMLIGDDIQVTVLGVKGSQVRLGIDAPKHVDIVREELVSGQIEQPPESDSTECV